MKIQAFRSQLCLFLVLAFISCDKKDSYEFSAVKPHNVSNFDTGFKEYCTLNLSNNFELNAVQCSFYGDYQNALDQATKDASFANRPYENISFQSDETDKHKFLEKARESLNAPNATAETKIAAQKIIELLTSSTSTEEVFAKAQPVSAIHYIVDKAKDYHFTLINEAHYNSQHRSFTKDLLKPLWDKGYRYLALETLSHEDTNLHERGYPLLSSGYYTKDSNFGNLVREAAKIGFRLIPYETQNNHHGTLRDADQANNILQQTLQKDKRGKVLIHAGYSHIFELGGAGYEPMGYQLKKLAKQDILTIDQERMTGLNDPDELDFYYREAANKFNVAEPTIFLNSEGKAIIDPINKFGIDIQVYHPMTIFEEGRPNWMKKEGIKQIPLPKGITAFKGCLLQASNKDEDPEAIPLDQFIISEGKVLLLPSGNYNLRIINCEGNLIATSKLAVD